MQTPHVGTKYSDIGEEVGSEQTPAEGSVEFSLKALIRVQVSEVLLRGGSKEDVWFS